MRALTLVCLVLFFAPVTLACATCYGDPEDPQTKAMNVAIIFMIGVVAMVLALFAAFFVHLRIRARQAANGELSTPYATPSLR